MKFIAKWNVCPEKPMNNYTKDSTQSCICNYTFILEKDSPHDSYNTNFSSTFKMRFSLQKFYLHRLWQGITSREHSHTCNVSGRTFRWLSFQSWSFLICRVHTSIFDSHCLVQNYPKIFTWHLFVFFILVGLHFVWKELCPIWWSHWDI